jgi:PAS domain S-box-containing protein
VETIKTKGSEYARSLIEASLDPLVTISSKGKIMDMNQALCNITGLSRAKLTGTDFLDYFTEPEKARAVYQIVFANGSVADSPLTLKHKSGVLTDVLFNGSVYKDDVGNVLGVVIVARDVTDQKRIATELKAATVIAEIATGVAEDAKVKADLARKLAEDAVKAKQQFLSNMSHEIRTPMNAIIGFTKVILKTELTPKQTEYLTAIKTSGDALIVLINDILDLAKVDAGKMVFEQTPFKMALSISAMLHLFEPKIHEKNIRLIKKYDDEIPEVLLGDPVRLHQIILNLLSNAVKFTKQGTITVSIKLLEKTKDTVKIEFLVADTGIGISDDKMSTIFENFQQASSDTSRLFGGTGLGLAIVKQLVEAQGGSINVRSVFEKGSDFCFTLTFQTTDRTTESDAIILTPIDLIKNVRILVVEDIALNQLLVRTLLDDFGFGCDIASNGKIAIEKLKTNRYDLILMDLQMPEMNGFEATEFIRKELKLKIPIIALTADVTTSDLAKCKSVGMDDYISKPVDERLLQSKIVSMLTRSPHPSSINILNDFALTRLEAQKTPYIDLNYLQKRTKDNSQLMIEMITLYLSQTAAALQEMQSSTAEKDWRRLHATAHKLIPSFSIVGIRSEFADLAKELQEMTRTGESAEEIESKVSKLHIILETACEELEVELTRIKTKAI